MGQKQRNAIKSHLRIAMLHIIKWISQPEKRSGSWKNSINNSQVAIEKMRKEQPSIPDCFIQENWDKKFEEATEKAEEEMGKKSTVDKLTWEQVFKTKYILPVLLVLIVVVVYRMVA